MTTTRVHTPTGGTRREGARNRVNFPFIRALSFHPATPSDPQRAGFWLGSPDSILTQSGAIWALGARLGDFSPPDANLAVLGTS